MEGKKLQEFYKTLYNMFYYDSKARTLGMAENQIGNMFLSSVNKIKRYLVQNYSSYGVTDTKADMMVDERRHQFVGLSGFSFISRSKDSTLAALDDELQKYGNALENVRRDYYKLFYSITSYANDGLSIINRYGYSLTSTQKTKAQQLLRAKSIVDELLGSSSLCVHTSSQLEDCRRSFVDVINAFIDFLYRCLNDNYSSADFCPLVETAYYEMVKRSNLEMGRGTPSVYEAFDGLNRYTVPKRNSTYVPFKYIP